MALVACRPVQALVLSGLKYLPLRCFVAAAPAPLLLHRLLHLPIRTSAYFNNPLRSEHSRYLFYSRQPRRDMAADGAVGVAVSQDDVLMKRMQLKLEALGIMRNDWQLGMDLYLPCPKCRGRQPTDKNLFFFIHNTGKFATWKCLGSDCGWVGKIKATGEFMDDYVPPKQATGEFMEQYAIRKPDTGEDMGHYSKIKQATGEVMEHYAKRKQANREGMEHYSKIKQATGEVMEDYGKIKQASKSEDCKIIAESQLHLEPLSGKVLMNLGPDALQKVIENAEFYPIRGLFQFGNFFHEIDAYYHQHLGYELGVSTGWRAVDKYYKVVPGELTVITGVPNSGKSEWIDALICNINKSDEWKFVVCSMESKVCEHARKLLEKHIKKPFLNARYCGSAERMSIDEYEKGKEWLFDNFCLIRCEVDGLPSIQWVLELAKAAVHRYGVRGLVIDPYNELDHQRDWRLSETEYVSQMLTKIKRFAQHHSCHVWFVAHPRQLQNWKGGPPNLYDISGSAHFINKCDNGIVIHRNQDENVGPLDAVQVCVLKVRNKVIGKIGQAFLSYDRTIGEFKDLN